jgi:ribonuclease HI
MWRVSWTHAPEEVAENPAQNHDYLRVCSHVAGEREVTTVFTDGACSGNPGPGGWGWAVQADAAHTDAAAVGPRGSGSELQSTNQRMEVWAVLDALTTLLTRVDDNVEVVSDSTYVVNCFRDSWWRGWESRGWKNSQKQPVANQDLWKPLVALYKLNSDRISFRWVKGHSGNRMNDLVDQLAVAAAQGQTPRTVIGFADNGSNPAPTNGLGNHASSDPLPIQEPIGAMQSNQEVTATAAESPLTLF